MLNDAPVNSYPINGFYSSASGSMFEIEESVLIIGSGSLFSIEQSVELLVVGSGLIFSIEQTVQTAASGAMITIEQNVTTANTFLLRNGYDFDIFIGGYQVLRSQLCGTVSIQKSAGKSGSCTFTMLPTLGIQNPESFQGKPVYVNIKDSTGTFRAFTGFIDTPTLDLIEKKIIFSCTDRRDSRILDMNPYVLNYIGKYSVDVFGVPRDQADEVDKRLSTVPISLDFDNYGNVQFTNWQPKTAADFVLSGNQIYYDKPIVSYTSRTKTLNTVNINMNYHFQRLHQQSVTFSWPGYDEFLADWFNQGTPSFPLKSTISNAAHAGDWKPLSPVEVVDLWPAGGYGSVQWQPNQVINDYKARTLITYLPYNPSPGVFTSTWPNGQKYPVESFILDANNKKIYDVVGTTIIDTSSNLCRGALWTAGLKFAQNVKQNYQLTIKSPQAITRFGPIKDSVKVDVTDAYDTSLWERDAKNYYGTQNFFVDKKNNFAALQLAIDVSLRRAKTALLAAHRDVTVNFRRSLWAQVDLIHTVQTTATQVSCKGKVESITHSIDIETREAFTDVSLLLSRSFAGDSEDVWSIPDPTDNPSYIGTPYAIELGTHVGLDPDPTVTPGAEKWNGYIGNKRTNSNAQTAVRTQFAESFIVDYPSIPDSIRGDRTVTSTADFDVVIPNDDLTVIF